MTQAPATDADLVARTLAGDRAAWGELYLRFRRLVARELGRVLWRAKRRHREDLDEAIQEFWAFAALNVLRQWRPELAGLSTYLTIRSHSWATGYLKRIRPGYCGPGQSSRDPVQIALAKASTVPSESPRPDRLVETADFQAHVRRVAMSCVRTIRERSVVLWLLDGDDEWSARGCRRSTGALKAYADELGVSRQRVRQLEARVLERLRPRLATLAAA